MTCDERRSRAFLALALFVALAAAAFGGVAAGQQGRAAPRALVAASAPSRIVFPPTERIALRMSHTHPAHRALPCARCHVRAPSSRNSRDRLIPEERACLPCHADRIDRSARSAERCGYCHVGYGASAPLDVPRSTFPSARIKFPHATHVSRGMACTRCHAGVPEARLATRAHMPTMRSCFGCHGGIHPSAPTACETCHETQPNGVMRTHFAEGDLLPPRWLFGMQHDRDWLVRHRWVGADHGDLCSACHEERDCSNCHDGRVRPPRVHPNDFLTTHPQLARRDSPRCTSCHAAQSFCLECHARIGVSPISAPDVRSASRFHPPPSVWIEGPVRHAIEARRSLMSCTSCHAERDCVVCHGALGVGGGVSPHPPGFAATCASALRTNARACAICHGDLGALAMRCR